jgi:hypothetical protein
MGYYAARRRFDGIGPGIGGGLALAVALHGTFDFAAFRAGALGEDGSGAAGLPAGAPSAWPPPAMPPSGGAWPGR